jgi:hypothetical protein
MILRSLAVALATTAIPLAVHAQDPRPDTGGVMHDAGAGTSQELAQSSPADEPSVTGPTGGTGTGMDPEDDAAMRRQRQDTGATGRTSPNQAADAGLQSSGPFVTIPATGAWRLADFAGTAVYGAEGEHIGEINDVLVGPGGQVEAVIIGVGGFLGIGEKDVAVSMNALEFGPGDGAGPSAAGNGTTGTGSAATAADTTAGTAPTATDTTDSRGFTAGPKDSAAGGIAREAERNGAGDPAVTGRSTQQPGAVAPVFGEDGLPDRVILSVTREQLEDAPAFEGVRSPYERG